MELNEHLVSSLTLLGISIDSLSDNEKKYLCEIYSVFVEHQRINEKLVSEFRKNKFNKSSLAERVDFSRQTLYMNPTLLAYVEWCESQAEKSRGILDSTSFVPREKYNKLKTENTCLLVNIVKDAIRDSEIERLAKENNELKRRVENLLARFEEKNEELNRLKKSIHN